MRTRRRRRRWRGVWSAVFVLGAIGAGSWYFQPGGEGSFDGPDTPLTARPAVRASLEPDFGSPPATTPSAGEAPAPSSPPDPNPKSKPESPSSTPAVNESKAASAETPDSGAVQPSGPSTAATSVMDAAMSALQRDDLLLARNLFSEALSKGLDGASEARVRAELTKLGEAMIFSPRIVAGDPLVDRYVIKAGDSLARIASQYGVTADLLASLNGIADKNRIREGQTIKVVKGPLRAVVRKRSFMLDVYLGDVLVGMFPVGLGADDSTPTGEWRIRNKLENPTYYPPRGGAIVSADDPANPLGERWIGLEGVSGEAVAQERYGIHGTNEPDSIGKSVSLGCIRLHNADVEKLYTYLVEGRSSVTVTN